MEPRIFFELVQGLTAGFRNVASLVTNTLREELFLRNIRPLVRRQNSGYKT